MKFIDLETLSLHIIDKQNKNDLEFVKKLFKDKDIKKWVHGISNILNENKEQKLFGHGFIVKDNNDYIGYIGIGEFNENEKCVYLRAGLDKDKVGMGYGKKILTEITEYIFSNFEEVADIKLKIDKNNKASLGTANSCGYKWSYDDYYVKHNPYTIKKTRVN